MRNEYIGLKNQGATCYLNSLVQALFMTPEFRNAIYNWNWKPPHPSYGKYNQCLLQQMQKLFLQLQKSDEHAIDTKQFTNSLGRGWAFRPGEQRDAHELLRCIFDTLEQIWQEKATESELSPMEFYRGKMEDYIKCQKCGNEQIRNECFLDIPLAVRNFDSATSFKNIEESLSAYLKPQQLEDEYCEHCNQGGGLFTGFRIIEFPRILTLHLKRFDMDWKTKQRYKLNDRIEFKDYMDLNKYIHKKGQNDDGNQKELDPLAMDCSNNEEGKITQAEDYFYELFAVITHGGSSNGGHYFAYIKNLDTDRWLCFNDTSVSFVTFDQVQQNTFGTVIHQQHFGESTSSHWPNHHEYYDNGTNAYVLMYRKAMFDESKRMRFMSELPSHLTAIVETIEKDKFMKSKNPSKNRTKVSDKFVQQNIKCATEVPVAEKNSTQNSDYDQMESAYNVNQMGAINQNYYMEEIDETSDVAVSGKMEKNVAQNQNIETISVKEFAKSLSLDNGNKNNQGQNFKKESWLLGNDATLMKWRQKKTLDLISDGQCLLDLTMDLIKKLEHLQLMIRPSAQMLRYGETWSSELKINCEKLHYDLSPFAYGKIFAFDSMHYALRTHQGRRLFTNWINFLWHVSTLLKQDRHFWLTFLQSDTEQKKIQILLGKAMECLNKLAEDVPKNEIKAVSDEICCNFKFFSSSITLIYKMEQMNLTDDMIKQSELIQRVLFALLCTLFELEWLPSWKPSRTTLLTGPWYSFLSMRKSELKFDPIDEVISNEISGNGGNNRRSVNLLCCYLRNLFQFNSQEGKDSVAYWLANHYYVDQHHQQGQGQNEMGKKSLCFCLFG